MNFTKGDIIVKEDGLEYRVLEAHNTVGRLHIERNNPKRGRRFWVNSSEYVKAPDAQE